MSVQKSSNRAIIFFDDDGPGIIEDDIGDEDELLRNLDDKDEN